MLDLNKFVKKRYSKLFNNLSEEAYIGKNNLVERMINLIGIIRLNLDEYIRNRTDEQQMKIVYSFRDLGLLISKEINISNLSIEIQENYDISIYCLGYDKRMWFDSDKQKNPKLNKQMQKELADIILDKNQYKFRNKEGKYTVMYIGINLFYLLSDEELTAVILHEIGHLFSEMFISIQENIYYNSLNSFVFLMRDAVLGLVNDITGEYENEDKRIKNEYVEKVLSNKKNIIKNLSSFNILQKNNKELTVDEEKLDSLNKTVFSALIKNKSKYEKKSEKIVNNYYKNELSNLKDLYEYNSVDMIGDLKLDEKPKKINIFIKLTKLFTYVLSTIIYSIYDNIIILITALINISYKRLSRKRLVENSSDSFVIMFGMSQYLTTALNKISKNRNIYKAQNTVIKDFKLNKIPIVNIIVGFEQLKSFIVSKFSDTAYEGEYQRYQRILYTLKAELNKNGKYLDNVALENINKDIGIIERQIEEFYGNDDENFIFKFVLKMLNKKHKKNRNNLKNDTIQEITNDILSVYDDVEKIKK